jgi:hypothetical protein
MASCCKLCFWTWEHSIISPLISDPHCSDRLRPKKMVTVTCNPTFVHSPLCNVNKILGTKTFGQKYNMSPYFDTNSLGYLHFLAWYLISQFNYNSSRRSTFLHANTHNTPTHIHTHTRTHTITHSHSNTHTQTHKLMHTHTHTQTFKQPHSI